jgi:uncharacterized protein YhaN
MRLNRLDLQRYGIFTDEVINFGDPIPGEPDFHIIYGPNEAGKSTTFAAFLDLLFGIEPKTRYGFLHDKSMLVGADLTLSGGRMVLRRIKGKENSLHDEYDKPTFNGPLVADLGSLNRASYGTIYSLDETVLERGGEEIMKSNGDLGQLLYSASAGLSGLSKKLSEIRVKADDIYRKGSSKNKIGALKAQMLDLKAKKKEIDTLATEYKRQMADRDLKLGRYTAASGDLALNRDELKKIGKLLSAFPCLIALRRDRATLEGMPAYPDPPAAWHDKILELQTGETAKSTLKNAIEENIRDARAALAEICVDHHVLNTEVQITTAERLKSKYEAAADDLPDVRREEIDANAEVSGYLSRIERPNHPNPEILLLPISVQTALEVLIDTKAILDEARTKADGEKTHADTQLLNAAAALREAGKAGTHEISAVGQTVLTAVLSEIRQASFSARIQLQTKRRRDNQVKLETNLPALLPWKGEMTELVQMAPPSSAERQRLKNELEKGKFDLTTAESLMIKHKADHIRLTAARDTLIGLPGVTADHQAREIRNEREKAWTAHRRSFETGTAEIFETAMRRDDEVTSNRHAQASDIARANQAIIDASDAKTVLDLAELKRDTAKTSYHALWREISALIQTWTPGSPDDLSLTRWEDWLTAREKALQNWDEVQTADREITDAETEKANLTQRIGSALKDAGHPQPDTANLDHLVAAAAAILAPIGEVRLLRKAVSDREQELEKRANDAARAEGKLTIWEQQWAVACQACWIAKTGPAPNTFVVKALLKELANLRTSLSKLATLRGRIKGMEEDQNRFEDKVAALTLEVGDEHVPGRSAITLAAIQSRLATAKTALELQKAKQTEIDKAEDRLKGVEAEIKEAGTIKVAMTTHFGVETLTDVATALTQQKARAKLVQQVDEAEEAILSVTETVAVADAEALLNTNDQEKLSANQGEREGGTPLLERTLSETYAAWRISQDALDAVGGDDAVARIEAEQRVKQMEIEDLGTQYLKLKIGTLAAEFGLQHYRETHRSSMLTNASSAFKTISRGNYKGLATQPDKDAEKLIAIGADGSTKQAADLSTGTRLQLYLALRVAGYKELAGTRPAMPFIADDIMESFDDFRAEEAFRLFKEMAEFGQVIYLTHHRHLVPIAQQVSPSVRIHNLHGPTNS